MTSTIGSAVLAAALLAALCQSAAADEHVVLVRSSAFERNMIYASPGDTVRFVPTEPGCAVQSIGGMLPDGADPIDLPADIETVVTLSIEGVYGYKCPARYNAGMVGIIQVGAPVNESAAKAVSHPERAAEVFEELLGSH